MANSKNWLPLFAGLVCLPTLLPWLVYHVYQYNERKKIYKKAFLKDKVVLVTGATSLLGKALAHAFYFARCKLILADQRKFELGKIKRELLNLKLVDVAEPALVVLDPNALDDMSRWAKDVLSVHGRLDILVNNDFSLPPFGSSSALDTPLALDIKFLVISYLCHIALTKAFLPFMMKEKTGGSIVSISSIHGKVTFPFYSSYAASKHALQAFFECLRAELANTNVNICVVSPSQFHSHLLPYSIAETFDTIAHGSPAQMTAERILSAIVNEEQELVLSPVTLRMVILLRHLMPSLFAHIMANRARRLSHS